MLINTDWVTDENIQYFGLAPGFVGLYQINVKVPTDRVAPGAAIDVCSSRFEAPTATSDSTTKYLERRSR